MRDRFRKGGVDALAEYELLELILFRAIPRRDVKPLAKALIARFGSFAEVVSARPERLREIEGLGDAAIVELKIVEAAAKRLAKSSIEKRPSLSSFAAVVDYCRTAMAFLDHEEFRVLFLDKKNHLIADEVQGVGSDTINSQDVAAVAKYLGVELPAISISECIRIVETELLAQNKFLTMNLKNIDIEQSELYQKSQFVGEVISNNRSRLKT